MLKSFIFSKTRILALFLLAVIAFGKVFIGAFSIRVYATVLMLLYLLLNIREFKNGKVVPITKVYIKLYILFLVIFFICLLATGDILSVDFFHRLLAYDLVCVVSFFAIYLIVNTKIQIRQIVLFLILVCLFDAGISILQFVGSDLGWSIGRFMGPIEGSEENADRYGGLLGTSYIPGIFGNVVPNAFVLASFLPLILFDFDKKHIGRAVLYLFAIVIGVVAVFLTQQRAAFYLVLLTLIAYFAVVFIHKPRLFFTFIFVVVIAFLIIKIEGGFSDFDFGRLVSMKDDGRSFMARYAMQFIPENFLFGGISKFTRVTEMSAHNIFFDSFIFAGIGGFISLMIFDIRLCLTCIRQVVYFVKNQSSQVTFALAMSMFVCTLYGFTHNTSVLTGDVVVFIILALLLKSIQLDKVEK